jgi:hypothetical protein
MGMGHDIRHLDHGAARVVAPRGDVCRAALDPRRDEADC